MLTPSRMALLDIAERLNLRTGQLAAAIDLLDEIEIREGVSPAQTLRATRFGAPASSRALVRGALPLSSRRCARYGFRACARPMERLSAEIAALKLPSGMRVDLPKDLGSDEMTIHIRARTGDGYGEAYRALVEKKAALVRIAKLIGGDDAEHDE